MALVEHRVQKLISNYGFCSRRKAEEYIESGKVKVNGKVISIGDKATEKDKITVDGKEIKPEKKVYMMFYKPTGCVTALTDSRYPTIFKYIRIEERVFPVGRLDYNTSGLLLLTNDGDFADRIMHPRYEMKKKYVAKIHKPLSDRDLRTLARGVPLADGKTRPAKIHKRSTKLIELTIHEGKNRIVRRMFEALGYQVKALKRIQIGGLELKGIKEGQWKMLPHKKGKWPRI